MRTTILTALALLPALHAFGQTTTIEVPQGSGKFPTVGQINCLEDVGGRYCSATWTCGTDDGELWSDMANNDGRRALDADSPVARKRGCTIEVDGAAEAAWYTAYTPAGMDTAPIGLSAVANPPAAVIRRISEPAVQGGSMIDYLIAEHGLDFETAKREACRHLRDDAPPEEWNRCQWAIHINTVTLLSMMAAPFSMCAIDLLINMTAVLPEHDGWVGSPVHWMLRHHPDGPYSPDVMTGIDGRNVFGRCEDVFRQGSHFRQQHERCCALFREDAARIGLTFE